MQFQYFFQLLQRENLPLKIIIYDFHLGPTELFILCSIQDSKGVCCMHLVVLDY